MKLLKLIPILFIFFGNIPFKNEAHAEIKNPEDFRVLSNESKKLSISNVEYFIKEGLYRLAKLATKKTTSIVIIPIGIAYSKVPPNFRGEFCLSFGKPIAINNYLNFTIKEFNTLLNEKMNQEEEKALKNVGR